MEFLISFKSGHYKKVRGSWKGDSVWAHFYKDTGGMVHINKDEIEYIEEIPELPSGFQMKDLKECK